MNITGARRGRLLLVLSAILVTATLAACGPEEQPYQPVYPQQPQYQQPVYPQQPQYQDGSGGGIPGRDRFTPRPACGPYTPGC